MSSNKAIIGLLKQNDAIYQSLVSKGIQFERIVISEGIDEDAHFKLLQEENTKLKELSKANKPISVPKEEKKVTQPVTEKP